MWKWIVIIVIYLCLFGKADALPPPQVPIPETGYNHLDVNISGLSLIQSGQEFKITITLINKTSVPLGISVTLGKPEFDNEIVVRGPYGLLEQRDESLNTSGFPDVVKPGDKWQDSCVISDLYDMTMPGIYTIRVRRHLRDGSILESNDLTVTVVK